MDKKFSRVSSYVKNVGKSIGLASIDVIKENTESTTEFIKSSKEAFVNMRDAFKDKKDAIKSQASDVKNNKMFKYLNTAINNLKDDIKTGDFYNKKREDEMVSKSFGFDELDSMFNDDTFDFDLDDDEEDKEVASSTKQKKSALNKVEDSINASISASAYSTSTAVARGTDLVVNANMASTQMLMNNMDKSSASINASMASVYSSISEIRNFMNTNLVSHMQNSKIYYENSIKLMQEQTAYLQEFLSIQKRIYAPKDNKNGYRKSKIDGILSSGGMPNMAEYAKYVKNNVMDSLGMFTMLFDMGKGAMSGGDEDSGGMDVVGDAVSTISRSLLKLIVGGLMGKRFKESLNSLDKTLSSSFTSLLAKLNSKAKSSPSNSLYGILNAIFGIDVREKTSISTSSFERGPVPFDGIARKSIVEVIPGYLARIESAITGLESRHYDMESGKWVTGSSIKRSMQKDRAYHVGNTYSNTVRDIDRYINGVKETEGEEAALKLRKASSKMIKNLYENNGSFDLSADLFDEIKYIKRSSFKTVEEYEKALEEARENNKNLYDFFKKIIKPNDMKEFASRTLESKQNWTRKMDRIEEAQNIPYLNLYNNFYGEENNLSKRIKRANSGILSNSFDKFGKNIFDYLREIVNRIGNRKTRNREKRTEKQYTTGERIKGAEAAGSTSDTDEGDSSDDDSDDFWSLYNELKYDKLRKKIEKENKQHGNLYNFMRDPDEVIKTIEENEQKKYSLAGIFGLDDENKKEDSNKKETKLDKFKKFINAPMNFASSIVEKLDKTIFNLIFGQKEFKTKEGKPIDNVFEYIMYTIKKSFTDLTSWMKSFYEKHMKGTIDNIKEKLSNFFGPIIKETKDTGGKIFSRFKTGLKNTFGSLGKKIMRGGVATAEEIKNTYKDDDDGTVDLGGIEESARGRIVTKRGLTMISPGEIIIPASFDKKEQDKMLSMEKKDRNSIINSIKLNAKGNINFDNIKNIKKIKDYVDNIIKENKGKGASVGAGGIIGGVGGILTGFGPLLGALLGSTISLIKNSQTLQHVLFGEKVGEDYEGGIIPAAIVNRLKKSGKDAIDFGSAGAVLGLLTKFGPIGGAAIGASIGLLKNTKVVDKFLFGDAERGKNGLIDREKFNKFKDKLSKAAPSMGIGALAGAASRLIIGGPFGIVGSAAVGAGLGLLSTTEKFKSFVFGDKDHKGLIEKFNESVLTPAKKKINEIIDASRDTLKKFILDPLKNFLDPFTQSIKNIITGIGESVKNKLDDIFEKSIGIPFSDFMQEKIFKPLKNTLSKIIKAPLAVLAGTIAAPFKLLGGIGNNMRMSQIRKGKAGDMSAAQRLQFRKDHPLRSMVPDNNLTADEQLANMTDEELSTFISRAETTLGNYRAGKRNIGSAGNNIGEKVSEFMNSDAGDGKNYYDIIGFDNAKKLASLAKNGNMTMAEYILNRKNSKLNQEQKDKLLEALRIDAENADRARTGKDSALNDILGLNSELEAKFGKSINGSRGLQSMLRQLKDEQAAREKSSPKKYEDIKEEDKTPVQKAIDHVADIEIQKKEIMNSILESANKAADYLHALADPKGYKEEAAIKKATEAKKGTESVLNTIKEKQNTEEDKSNIVIDAEGNPQTTEEPKGKSKSLFEKLKEAAIRKKDSLVEEAKDRKFAITEFFKQLFGDKKNKKDKGLLGNISSGIGNLMSLLGFGTSNLIKKAMKVFKIGAGISLLGFASEWIKNTIGHKIKTMLFGKEKEDGTKTGGILGGIKSIFVGKNGVLTKLFGFINEKITSIKKWYESKGGLSGLVTTATSKMVEGWGYAMDNILAPALGVLIRSLPTILIGTVKGILKGLKLAVMNKTVKRSSDGNVSIDVSDYTKELSTIKSNKAPAKQTTSSVASIDVNSILKDNEKTSNNTSTVSSIFGSTERDNTVEYDENGNIVTEYSRKNTTDTALSRIAKSSANAAVRGFVGINSPKIIQKLGNVGIKAVGPGLGSKVITGAASTAATVTGKVLGGANSLGAKAAKVATNAAEAAAEKGAVKKGLPAIFEKLATGKVGQFILGKAVKPLGEKAFVTAMRKAGEKLSGKLTTKLAGKALTKVAGAIAKTTPVGLIMMAVDFLRGMDDAYTNFGVAKGGEYKISIFQRIISGLVELVSANLTFGLIPSDTIIDVFVDFLAPFFNIDVENLQQARETAGDVMDQWNKEHPEETYDNLEDFNNRGKFWKWSNIKKGVSKGWENITSWEGWDTAGGAIKNGFKATGEFFKNSFDKVGQGLSNVGGWFKDIFTTTNDATVDAFKAAYKKFKYSWQFNSNKEDAIKEEDTKLKKTKNIFADGAAALVYHGMNILTAPSRMLGKLIGGVVKVFNNMQAKNKIAANAYSIEMKKIDKARNGEISVFSSEYWKKNSAFENTGLFGGLYSISAAIAKVLNAPIAIISSLGKSVVDFVTGEWAASNGDNYSKDKLEAAATAKDTYGAGHAYQSDPAISKMRYAGSTIEDSGCAPVAATNLLNRYRSGSMNVEDAARFAEKNGMTIPGKGTNIAYFSSFLSKNGLKTSRTSNKGNVINALMEGKQVVMLGKDSNNNSTSAFGTNPHYITAIGLDKNGNIIVEDPDNPRERIRYRTKNVMSSMITSVIAGKGKSHGGGGGSFDSSTTSDTSSEETSASEESSSSGTLTTALTNLARTIMRKIYGDNAYNAIVGESGDENSSSTNNTGLIYTMMSTTNASKVTSKPTTSSSTTTLSKFDKKGIQEAANTPGSLSTVQSSDFMSLGDTDEQRIWNYLINKGYSKAGVAGMMGNFKMESGLRSNNMENSYERKLGYTDESYTKAVDDGSYSKESFIRDAVGYGLPQFTYSAWKKGLYENTVEKGKSIGSAAGQLDYLTDTFKNDWALVNKYKLNEYLKNASDPQAAASKMFRSYEMPNVDSVTAYTFEPERKKYAQEIYDTYAGLGRGTGAKALRDAYYGRARTSTSSSANNVNYSTINYESFLSTIVSILSSILTNTAALSKILDILSEKFDINIDKSDISEAAKRSKKDAERALRELVSRSTGNATGMTKLLNNKDTGFLLNAMTAIAKE